MFRKLLLLVLFVAFSALVLSLLSADRSGASLFFGGRANPSTKPLPQAWSGAGRAQVRLSGQPAPAVDAQVSDDSGSQLEGAICPSTVSVQRGDTMGAIAKRCGISLADLLSANPAISNPNRIYSGQQIVIYGERGGGGIEAVTAQPPSGSYLPGAQVVLDAEGFASGARVKIGIGLPGAGFQALGVYNAGSDGRISVALTIPDSARPGERAFFLLASTGAPTVTVISEAFVIGY